MYKFKEARQTITVFTLTFSNNCFASSPVIFPREYFYFFIGHILLPILLLVILALVRNFKHSKVGKVTPGVEAEFKNLFYSLAFCWFLSVVLIVFGLLAAVPVILYVPSYFALIKIFQEFSKEC